MRSISLLQKLKYLRVRIHYKFLHPFSERRRKKRMSKFVDIMQPYERMKILDLGGQPKIWDSVDLPLDITMINLPGSFKHKHDSHHKITYVEGDACDMPFFKPGQFDLVFSNSVIEHVGDKIKQIEFTNEVKRLSSCYWIQTPHKYFPIEAHCGMPFWWFYPEWLRQYFIKSWHCCPNVSRIIPTV